MDVCGNMFVKFKNVFFSSEYVWNFAALLNLWKNVQIATTPLTTH